MPARSGWGLSVSVLALGAAWMAQTAQAEVLCAEELAPQPEGCERSNADTVVTMPAGENTERVTTAMGGDFAAEGFSISVDQAPTPGPPRRRVRAVRPISLLRRSISTCASTGLTRAEFSTSPQMTCARPTGPATPCGFAPQATTRPTWRGRRSGDRHHGAAPREVAVLPVAPNGTVPGNCPPRVQMRWSMSCGSTIGRAGSTRHGRSACHGRPGPSIPMKRPAARWRLPARARTGPDNGRSPSRVAW